MNKIKSTILIFLLCAILLGLWIFSYKSYGLLAYEAYSGVGTELASVRGLVVFYHFDSYEGGRPPQNWGCGFLKPTSKKGEELKEDFDFWDAPYWWSRLGFFYLSSNTMFTGHTNVRLVSIPYWFPTIIMISLASIIYYRKRHPKKDAPNAA